MIKHERDGMKVAVFTNDIVAENNFCIKLFPGGVAHFMPIEKAVVLADMIKQAVDRFNEVKKQEVCK